MKCMFCGSYDLATIETYTKDQFVEGKQIAGHPDMDGVVEVKPEMIPISVTRRKMKCKNCKNHFWTVEHFDKSTKASSVQKLMVAELTLYNNSDIKSNLTDEDKEKLNRLIQEDYL